MSAAVEVPDGPRDDEDEALVEAACGLLQAEDGVRLLGWIEAELRAGVEAPSPASPMATQAHVASLAPPLYFAASAAGRWITRWRHAQRQAERTAALRLLLQLRARVEHRWLTVAEPAAASSTPEQAPIGPYIALSYELVAGRAAHPAEIESWRDGVRDGRARIADLQAGLLGEVATPPAPPAPPSGGYPCRIMGTGIELTPAQWRTDAEAIAVGRRPEPMRSTSRRLPVGGSAGPRVSAILSLWRGGRHIRRFMANMVAQDGFDELCELVIVDAESPEGEHEVIEAHAASHRNIRYLRCARRIGIYEAWNRAVAMARGDYLTSTNVDDLRRHDSLLLQAGVLDALPHVDVVYQDVLYTLDPGLSFEEIEAFDHVSELPIVTPHNLLQMNSPHSAPMWRKRLHDELGLFDTRYQSAADSDFWVRCLAAGKVFHKIEDPHVAYYHNPDGISTRASTPGPAESRDIALRYARRLMPAEVMMGDADFAAALGLPLASLGGGLGRRDAAAARALHHSARRLKHAAQRGGTG